jgi:hypothetical protein
VLDCLAGRLPVPGTEKDVPGSSAYSVPFVGRSGELAKLHEAFHQSRQGQAVVVHLRGLSGMGKTTLHALPPTAGTSVTTAKTW